MIDLEAAKKWFADGRIVTIDSERYYEAMSEIRAYKICAAHNDEVAIYLSEIEALRRVAVEARYYLLHGGSLADLEMALSDAGYGGGE